MSGFSRMGLSPEFVNAVKIQLKKYGVNHGDNRQS